MIEIKLEMKGNIVFSSFPLSYEVILPNGYQNGSSSTERAVRGAEAQKTASPLVKPCQTGPTVRS
jgi:hypothetical protein